jgi:hypothetical protein
LTADLVLWRLLSGGNARSHSNSLKVGTIVASILEKSQKKDHCEKPFDCKYALAFRRELLKSAGQHVSKLREGRRRTKTPPPVFSIRDRNCQVALLSSVLASRFHHGGYALGKSANKRETTKSRR